ncbi:MAG: efflux RND transporter periplasmic adaptor subunit [Candidatus Omnitrophota bacterium]
MYTNKVKKAVLFGLILLLAFGFIFTLTSCGKKTAADKDVSGKEVLYYTCGMHPSVRVSVPQYEKGDKNCPICHMDLIPVYKEETSAVSKEESKVLFYRNPMNPSITSQVPAKDAMGMDYVPVYKEADSGTEYYGCGMEGAEHVFQMKDAQGMKCPICGMDLIKLSKEEADKLKGVISRVKIKGEQISLAGVKEDLIREMQLFKEIRTVGKVAYDPNLAISEEEFISALTALDKIESGHVAEISARAETLVESSRRKLRLLGLSDTQIGKLEDTREVNNNYVLPADEMWVYGEVYEYELSWVKPGENVSITTASVPGREFTGVISSLNPVINPKTRSITFRVEVANPGLELKPDMYVDIIILSMYKGPQGQSQVLAIVKDAVLDTGMRKIVWIDSGKNEYEGRSIEVGPEAVAEIDGQQVKVYPVLRGVAEGERVVTRANFLIDSQSQLSGVASAAYGGALEDKE